MDQIDYDERRFQRRKNCMIFSICILFIIAIILGIKLITTPPSSNQVDITLGGSSSIKKELKPGEYLRVNQYIASPSKNYFVGLTNDGDLVLKDIPRNKIIWNANTIKGLRCIMQKDGNLVIHNKNKNVLWSSGTSNNRGSKLIVDDNGRASIIYNNNIIWMEGIPSGTYTNPPSKNDLTFPVRGAFYYAWYPETWRVSSGALTKFKPDLGYYNSGDPSVVTSHIKSLDYGNINVGIISWWGQSSGLDKSRITLLLNTTSLLKSTLKWAVYYEDEMKLNPSVEQIKSDLLYLLTWYAWHPSYAHINGKPVIFIYNDGGCDVMKRWITATNGEWYVVPKVFSKFYDCGYQPDAWHQYGPASSFLRHEGYSVSISPGFWKADEDKPRLERLNHSEWCGHVQDMVDSNEPWQLITTFNEAGEGTLIEPSSDNWASESGYGYYLDCLHHINNSIGVTSSAYNKTVVMSPRKAGND